MTRTKDKLAAALREQAAKAPKEKADAYVRHKNCHGSGAWSCPCANCRRLMTEDDGERPPCLLQDTKKPAPN